MPHQPTSDQLLANWEVPLRGTLRNVPIYRIGKDALYDSLNVLVREGSLQPRPGLTLFDGTALNGRVIGAYSAISIATGAFQDDAFQNDAFQVAANVPGTTLVVATPAKILARTGAGWLDVTDTPLTAVDSSIARFTSIELANVLHVLHTNGIDAPRDLRSDSSVVTVVAGNPPKFTDWTTVAGQARVVGIVPPYTVRWSPVADIGTWPVLNNENLSGTPDRLVAIRNLGTLGVAVYKTHSIWIGVVTGSANDEEALRFEPRGWFDGPASAAAVVDAGGSHYYMTESGRIGRFSGMQHDWVADGILPLIQADMDKSRSGTVFGVWEPTRDEVYFFYPRTADAGQTHSTGIAIIIPPKPDDGIESHVAFLGRLGFGVSTGTDLRMDTKDVLLFGASDHKSYKLGGVDDAGTNFSGYFQTGLTAAPGVDPHRLVALEPFAERALGYGTLSIKPTFSNLLDTPAGTLATAITVSLAASTAIKDLKGADLRARFFGLRGEFTTPITLRWKGARMLGHRVE